MYNSLSSCLLSGQEPNICTILFGKVTSAKPITEVVTELNIIPDILFKTGSLVVKEFCKLLASNILSESVAEDWFSNCVSVLTNLQLTPVMNDIIKRCYGSDILVFAAIALAVILVIVVCTAIIVHHFSDKVSNSRPRCFTSELHTGRVRPSELSTERGRPSTSALGFAKGVHPDQLPKSSLVGQSITRNAKGAGTGLANSYCSGIFKIYSYCVLLYIMLYLCMDIILL